MDSDSRQEHSKRPSRGVDVPVCVHLYVWLFMVAFGVSPMVWLLWAHDHTERGAGLESVAIIALIQAGLWLTQRRCSSEDLSYWDGLLIAAATVTTPESLISLFRVFYLLFAVVIVSVMFAVAHDGTCAERHAELRFGRLIIALYRQRFPKKPAPDDHS